MEQFAQAYHKARKSARLTQQDICSILKIPTRTQQEWEAGDRTPPEYVQILVIDKLQSLTPAEIKTPETK